MRLVHRVPASVLATAAVAGGAILAVAAPAAAAPDTTSAPPATVCSIDATGRVPVDAARTRIPLRLKTDCPVGAWGSWDLFGPRGEFITRVSLTQGTSAGFVVGDAHPYGTYRLRPVTAYAHDFGQIPQNTATLTVAAGSHTDTRAARSGAAVRVAATTTTYDRRTDTFRPRPRTRIALQRAACARTCPWVTVAQSTTDATGRATLTAPSTEPAAWRTVVAGTTTTWGSVSRPVIR